jgi:hypothetical protein
MPLLSISGTGEEPPGKLAPVQLVGRASRQAGYCLASLGEPPDQLAQHQLIRRAPQSAETTSAYQESLPISWHYTSLLGEPPNQLALHQLVGRASRPAGTAREPPDQLAMYQLGERASRSRWPSSTELNTSLATLSHRVEHLAGQAWPTS